MSPPITILIEPPRVEVPISGMKGQYPADPMAGYSAFAEALRRYTAGPVDLRTGFLRDVAEGVVVVRSSDYDAMMTEAADDVRARTILLEVDRSAVLPRLERHRVAGAISKPRWLDWCWNRDGRGGGMHGLRTVAAAMGASVFESVHFASEHYVVLSSDRYSDLPGLVVGYIDALSVLRA